MSDMNVKFLGNEYVIPSDIIMYIDLLSVADSIQRRLMRAFTKELNKDDTGCIDDKDLSADIHREVSIFIARLCDHGIYNRTVNDYLRDNKGYQLFSDANKAALRKMKDLLIQEMDAWQAGYETAVNKAESHVTGMGFSIWSGSFVNHAIYAAMEASTLNKQEKEANQQYRRDMEALSARLEATHSKGKSEYIRNVYIPQMETALTVFAYELLDKFVADMVSNHKFDAKTMDYVDIGRSNDLLENLNLSSNKKAIIESAFEACPYNAAVYMQAMKHDLLDYDTFQTSQIFKQSDTILSFLKENWGKVSYPSKFDINYYCVNILASFTDQTPEAFLRVHTEQYATGIVKAYARVAEMISDNNRCRKIMGEYDDNTILADDSICSKKAQSYVNTIVDKAVWDQLTEQCGHKDLLKRITKYVPQEIAIESKENADLYLIEQLCAAFEEARMELVGEITKKRQEAEERRKEELRRKQEAERIREEKRQQQIETNRKAFKVLMKVAAGLLAVVIVYFAILLINDTVINPAKQYKAAVDLMEAGDFQSARAIFESLDGYRDSEAMIEQCNTADAEEIYNTAVQLMAEKKYIEAITAFRTLDGYKDSDVLIGECQGAYRENEYNKALQLMDEGKYEEAIIVFEKLGNYNDSVTRIAECEESIIASQYIYAIELANKGSYDESISILKSLGDYRDAEEIIEKCHLLGCEVGDEIVFGSYEQDGNLNNGTEDIEWIVLERDGGKVLIISKYCLDQKPFNETLAPVTWKDCTVRKWLNGDFWRTAFTGAEASQVVSTRISYPDDVEQEYEQDYTYDKVFLLSENEVLHYFDSDWDRAADATEYVKTSHCYWILRTHGSVSNVAHVEYNGHVGYYENVDRNWWIRPAMWIEIKDIQFDSGNVELASKGLTSIQSDNSDVITEDINNDFNYVVCSDGTVEITEYIGNDSAIAIPSHINGKVVKIGDRAFYNCNYLKEITISEGITVIGELAFAYTSNLQSIIIPKSVSVIEEKAFVESGVKKVIINGCDTIGNRAFYCCRNLQELTIGDGVSSVGELAFAYTDNLQSVVIPDSVTVIGEKAFIESGIKTVTVDGFSEIGSRAFYSCRALGEIRIHEGVTAIGELAFAYTDNLQSVTIPKSVTYIGEKAFIESGVQTVTLNGCSVVGSRVFYSCRNLEELIIAEGVTTIGELAFAYTNKLQSVTIPSSVTSLGEKAFTESGVNSVTINGSSGIGSRVFYSCKALKNLTIEGGVTSIGELAFAYTDNLQCVTIPGSVTMIGEKAFTESGLESVTINGCSVVGSRAFYNCNNLKTVIIAEGVNSIGESAFRYCDSLETVTIEGNNVRIGQDAFADCDRLKNIPQ